MFICSIYDLKDSNMRVVSILYDIYTLCLYFTFSNRMNLILRIPVYRIYFRGWIKYKNPSEKLQDEEEETKTWKMC